jgi:hypothetical protein
MWSFNNSEGDLHFNNELDVDMNSKIYEEKPL